MGSILFQHEVELFQRTKLGSAVESLITVSIQEWSAPDGPPTLIIPDLQPVMSP